MENQEQQDDFFIVNLRLELHPAQFLVNFLTAFGPSLLAVEFLAISLIQALIVSVFTAIMTSYSFYYSEKPI